MNVYLLKIFEMSTLFPGISDFLKLGGITGHPILDSLIIANIIPLLIAYINMILNTFKLLSDKSINFISSYVSSKIKTKFLGKVLGTITFYDGDRLFHILNSLIFDPKVSSDIDSNMIRRIFSITDDDNDSNKWFQKFLGSTMNFDAHIDYTGEKLIKFSSRYGFDNIEKKAFRYKNYFIRASVEKGDKLRTLKLELISFKDIAAREKNTTDFGKIIESFLNERFDFKGNVSYVYKITISNANIGRLLNNFVNNGEANHMGNLLKYNDKNNESQLSYLNDIKSNNNIKFFPEKVNFDIKCNNITDIEMDLKDKFIFRGRFEHDENTNLHSQNTISDLFKKYIQPMIPSMQNWGYYLKDGNICLLYATEVLHNVVFITFGKLLDEHYIKQELEWILKTGFTSNLKKLASNKQNMYVYKLVSGKWNPYVLDTRSFDTIYLPEKLMNEIRKEIDNFQQIEKLYRECNIPYKKGLLLYGAPGTGKTSLVKAIAYEYQMFIYTINVNDEHVNDDSIVDILNSIGDSGNKILLFEDIDTAFADKEKIKFEDKFMMETLKINCGETEVNRANARRKYLTYSGLLNALDGALSNQRGVITIMTTNYIDKLGSAILRPGRIDRKFELKECNAEQFYKMTETFINKRLYLLEQNKMTQNHKDLRYKEEGLLKVKLEKFVEHLINRDGMSKDKIKPCQFQYYLLKHIEDLDELFADYGELSNLEIYK